MSDFDDAPALRLRPLRRGVLARYVLEVGVSHEEAGTVVRRPIRWWHAILRTDVSQEREPGRFTVSDATGRARAVVTRRGGVRHVGELVVTEPDGRPIGTMTRSGPRLRPGHTFEDPNGSTIGWTERDDGLPTVGHDAAGAAIGRVQRISSTPMIGRHPRGVERGSTGLLRAGDPHEQGVLIEFVPTATPLLRLMLVVAAIQL